MIESIVWSGRHIESRLPDCTAKYLDGESHSMIRRQWGSVLRALVAAASAAAAAAADTDKPKL
jgi:hypothetical protein